MGVPILVGTAKCNCNTTINRIQATLEYAKNEDCVDIFSFVPLVQILVAGVVVLFWFLKW